MFGNLTIKSRLIFVISLLSVLLVVVGLLGLRGINAGNEGLRSVYEDSLVAANHLAEINLFQAENQRQVHLLLMHDPQMPEILKLHDHPLSFHFEKMAANTKKNNENWDAYLASHLTPEEKSLADRFLEKRKGYQTARNKALELIKAGNYLGANTVVNKEVNPAYVANLAEMHKLIQLQSSAGKQEYENVLKSNATTRNISLATILIGILLAALIGTVLIRNISRSLRQALGVASRIAEGDLSSKIQVESHDEVGLLLTSMSTMQGAINAFVAAQHVMAQKHAEGWIKEQIDPAKFPGTYGRMAREVNDLVNSHIAVNMKVVEVITQYAKGNFSLDMDKLPGEKAKITAAIDNVKKSLLEISSEIKMLAEAGAKGDFSKRGAEAKFDFMFKEMIRDLNTLVETCDIGFNDVLRVAQALADGDLSQKITKDYPGVFGQTKVGVNNTADSLTRIVAEIKNIVEAAAVRGDFSVKMDLAGKAGYTKPLSELLNKLSDVSDVGLHDVIRVANALADGDLTQTITKDYPGLFGQTKDGINATVEKLSSIIGEVRGAADSLSSASEEVSATAQSMSQASTEQAASVEQTSASIEQMSASIKQNSENA